MAAYSARNLRISLFLHVFLLFNLSFADDVSHDDESAPKSAACNNKFQLVKVKNWVNGAEGESFVGLSARFGASLPNHAAVAHRTTAVMANPFNCCTNSSSKLSNSIALSKRGDCTFTAKAEVAQVAGAAGLLIMNDNEDLYKMVCTENDTSLNITIPVVMIPKSAGESMKDSFSAGGKVELLLYSPKRPVVDISEIFLWLMAVGTIVCASLWTEFVTCEQTDERYNQLGSPNAGTTNKDDSEKEVLDINAKGAIIFVITASAFLLLLYFFMSSWFVWLLIMLFCIGGIEVYSSYRLHVM